MEIVKDETWRDKREENHRGEERGTLLPVASLDYSNTGGR
jgi:hypothetical protein